MIFAKFSNEYLHAYKRFFQSASYSCAQKFQGKLPSLGILECLPRVEYVDFPIQVEQFFFSYRESYLAWVSSIIKKCDTMWLGKLIIPSLVC